MAGATVRVQSTAETTVEDVLGWADALILGSPVHYGNPVRGHSAERVRVPAADWWHRVPGCWAAAVGGERMGARMDRSSIHQQDRGGVRHWRWHGPGDTGARGGRSHVLLLGGTV